MAPSDLSHDSTILIVGAGVWGCSTALHLVRRGYKNVTVLDPYTVPSAIAAGNDINKIMEHREPKESDTDPRSIAFATCTRAALKGWKTDPVFKPYFHETGVVVSGHTPALIEHIRETEIEPSMGDFVKLETAEDFRKTMPAGVLTGKFPGWQGWLNKSNAGWIHAQKAMVSAYTEAKRLGVKFLTGSPQGNVVALVFENGDVVGARTSDGVVHRADRTILSAGAGSDRLLDFEKQLRPTAWTLCHIKMTPEEAKRYKNLPVLFNIAKGFFMEPDEDKHELKICDEHPGYCNFVPDPKRNGDIRSIPFPAHQIPLEAEARARDFLRDTMPQLADRPLSFARICWDADTPDRAFLIDRHPKHPSLVVAVGASGNGAMQMPSIGGFIADALEGHLQKEVKDVVRWRPETAVDRDWKATQNRFGGPDAIMDFQKVKESAWTKISEKSRL
ncbi:NAD(P)/FAD-dependent oxidoreductase [Aspergillus aculeatinus CBS 121060]|uniref:FAD dependent oxidoreductase n=1 Tax=Aspergillus aculeatinus CBS 121060 TaxID=1448322 RepID=A0ACD1GXA1_9EURO|nr:FAD dependent oxidoreductase [Aspergillus aculeatinus CBS 121060]RAH65969.1 FAD dependent oxidoreductase [Aspergillus aculeatinus CBS 121060]